MPKPPKIKVISIKQARFAAEKALLYYDRGVILVNKPTDMVCQMSYSTSAKYQKFNILLKGIQQKLGMQKPPCTVHRLDKDTTGALFLARTSLWARKIQQQFLDGTISKTYLALVHGGKERFPETSGVIETRLLEAEDGRVRLHPEGKETKTEWEVLGSSPRVPLTLLRLKLLTGHKHQLRIHLAKCLGAPILGDELYAKEESKEEIRKGITIPRKLMFLHASEISLQRWNRSGPQKQYTQTFKVPVPTKFQVVCRDAKIPIERKILEGQMLLDDKIWDSPDHLCQKEEECWVSHQLLPKPPQIPKADVGAVHET